MTRDALGNSLARSVTDQYASLGANGKPRARTNGVSSWTILAGFSLYRDSRDAVQTHCVSIGTGLKALPHSKLPVHGDVLHDSHAEIIARRGLKLWLYDQLDRAVRGDESSFLERTGDARWTLRDGWKLGMWISTLPCGDASTYSLSLAAPCRETSSISTTSRSKSLPDQPDPPTSTHASLQAAAALGLITTRTASLSLSPPDPSTSILASSAPSTPLVHRGRVAYESFSTLRTKPGRADSLPTTSHSCSDKIAMWSLVGVQGSLLSTLGVRVYVSYVAVSGIEGGRDEREKVRGELRRAIGGRLEGWTGPRGEGVRVPEVGLTSELEFEHSREVVAKSDAVRAEDVASCQESLSWIETIGTEVVTNGIRQGASPKRKAGEPLGPKARSRLSKLSLFQRHLEVARALGSESASGPRTYHQAKHADDPGAATSDYQELKAAVRDGPFKGWLLSGKKWEDFDERGRVGVEP
ncbi:hypothetical protein JCM11491_006087 [Sporobolomyces phaffii]